MGVLDKLDGATTRTEVVDLIMDAALAERWEELSNQLDDAAKSDYDSGSLAMPAATKTVNEMDKIRDQVEASRVYFHFEPMDWTERLSLQAEHPPRPSAAIDQLRGFNVATFIPALIRATCVKVVDEVGDESTEIPAATWDTLLGNPAAEPPVRPKLAAGQVDRLYAAASKSNQGVSRVPPSARFLLGSQDTGASLAQPSPGTPPRNGSQAGSPRGSRKSSTAKKAAPTRAASSAS